MFDREANEDIQIVLGGGTPDEREDISPEYINYLNEWLLTDKFMLLQQKQSKTAAKLSQFVDGIIAKAQRKADKLALQPAPDASVSPLATSSSWQSSTTRTASSTPTIPWRNHTTSTTSSDGWRDSK